MVVRCRANKGDRRLDGEELVAVSSFNEEREVGELFGFTPDGEGVVAEKIGEAERGRNDFNMAARIGLQDGGGHFFRQGEAEIEDELADFAGKGGVGIGVDEESAAERGEQIEEIGIIFAADGSSIEGDFAFVLLHPCAYVAALSLAFFLLRLHRKGE